MDRAFAQEERLQAVEVDVLGKALVDQPGPAAREEHPAVFGNLRVEVGRQQRIVAAGKRPPGHGGAQHGAAAVGGKKAHRLLQEFGAAEHPAHVRILRLGQVQEGGFRMPGAVFGVDRQMQRERTKALGRGPREKQAEVGAVAGRQAVLGRQGAVPFHQARAKASSAAPAVVQGSELA